MIHHPPSPNEQIEQRLGRELLDREIVTNKQYDAEQVKKIKDDFRMYAGEGMGGRGGQIPQYEDNRPTSIPTDSIDYWKEYNESR
ncbi:hypothetical protein [Marispirochaeta sp.]|uniref:hypothetical protein n=1 Tax=Marispirochaeta sp. TaxID=2038653 RepID=UPI0029C95E88|nr:hypothetical protein [Marispirochaeta sp.]